LEDGCKVEPGSADPAGIVSRHNFFVCLLCASVSQAKRVVNTTLTKRQISLLRGLGQGLRPALHVGREGYTERTQQALAELFAHRELVKARVLPSAGVT